MSRSTLAESLLNQLAERGVQATAEAATALEDCITYEMKRVVCMAQQFAKTEGQEVVDNLHLKDAVQQSMSEIGERMSRVPLVPRDVRHVSAGPYAPADEWVDPPRPKMARPSYSAEFGDPNDVDDLDTGGSSTLDALWGADTEEEAAAAHHTHNFRRGEGTGDWKAFGPSWKATWK